MAEYDTCSSPFTVACRIKKSSETSLKQGMFSDIISFANSEWKSHVKLENHLRIHLWNVTLSKRINLKYYTQLKNEDGSMISAGSGGGRHTITYSGDFILLDCICRPSWQRLPQEAILRIICCFSDSDDLYIPTRTLSGASLKYTVELNSCPENTSSPKDNKTFYDSDLKDMLDSVTIHMSWMVKGQELQAHKSGLTGYSSNFAAMLPYRKAVKYSGVVDILDDLTVGPDTFYDFLLFFYSGTLAHVSTTNAAELYGAAHKFEAKVLKVACAKCLKENLFVDTIFEVMHLANKYYDSDLHVTAMNFFMRNFTTIMLTKWDDFLWEEPIAAHDVLLQVVNDDRFKSIISYPKEDFVNLML